MRFTARDREHHPSPVGRESCIFVHWNNRAEKYRRPNPPRSGQVQQPPTPPNHASPARKTHYNEQMDVHTVSIFCLPFWWMAVTEQQRGRRGLRPRDYLFHVLLSDAGPPRCTCTISRERELIPRTCALLVPTMSSALFRPGPSLKCSEIQPWGPRNRVTTMITQCRVVPSFWRPFLTSLWLWYVKPAHRRGGMCVRSARAVRPSRCMKPLMRMCPLKNRLAGSWAK